MDRAYRRANFLAKRQAYQTHACLDQDSWEHEIAMSTVVETGTFGFPCAQSPIKLPIEVIGNIFAYTGTAAIKELYRDDYIHGRNIVAYVEQSKTPYSPTSPISPAYSPS